MEARLIRHRGIHFLYLDEETIIPMKMDAVKDFLMHYTESNYYGKLIDKYSIPALKRRFSSEPEVLMIVTEDNDLIIKEPKFLQMLLASASDGRFISTEEFAQKHGKKKAIVLRMCREGRIEGAKLINSIWVIPADAPYPVDARKGRRLPYAESSNKSLSARLEDCAGVLEEVVCSETVE